METLPPQMMAQGMEEAGRGTDTVLAHLSLGEVVIPRAFLDDPQVMEMLQMLFQQGGADIAEFTVGDPANKINPETGYPEFFLKKLFKKVAPFIAPAVSLAFPGLGTALGSALLGAGATGASTLGSALIGGGLGALTGGGLKGALTGALTSGIGANIGSLGGSALHGPTLSGAPLGLSQGSGILGAVGNATGLTANNLPSLSGLIGGSGGGSSFSPLSVASNIFSGINQNSALEKQKKQLLGANQQQLANLETFDPSNITNDAGYQFNLAQGQQGLNRALGAQGNLFSGAALKAASEYNQGYANNAFNSAYQRWADKTGAKNAIIGNSGLIGANTTASKANNLSQSLAGVLGGNGGYSAAQLAELLRLQRGY